jgi:hypothetical protein
VFRFRLDLRTALLESNRFFIHEPRCSISAAKQISPVSSEIKARPVFLLPGSIFSLRDLGFESGTDRFKIKVNGYLLKTAAFPRFKRNLARFGLHMGKGFLFTSITKTFLIKSSFKSIGF